MIMEKKLQKLPMLLLLCVGVCLTACNSNEDEPIIGVTHPRDFLDWGPNLTGQYFQLDSISFLGDFRENTFIHLTEGSDITALCDVRFSGVGTFGGSWASIMLPNRGWIYPLEGLHERLLESFNDTSFNPWVENSEQWKTDRIKLGNSTLAEDVINIKVTALDDFDTEHPAGSSLNDFIYLNYVSFYDYIQEGYVWNEKSEGNGWLTNHIDKNKPTSQYEQYSVNHYYIDAGISIKENPQWNGSYFKEAARHILLSDIAENPIMGMSYQSPRFLSFHRQPERLGAHKFRAVWTLKLHCGGYEPRKIVQEFEVEFK